MENSLISKIIIEYFNEITQRPHPSGKEDSLRAWVIEKVSAIQAKYTDNRSNLTVALYDPGATEPGARNILLRRTGAHHLKEMAPIILQAHLDMVAVPTENIFPIQTDIYTDSNHRSWLKANQTTLGADDGIGVATILALLEEELLSDVALECLFTVQEETDMGGAQHFDHKLLSGAQLINLDAEELTIITYGSAGGSLTEVKGKITYQDDLTAYKTYRIAISGLKSGHSGVDINQGRQNALKILADLLARLNKRLYRLESQESINSYDLILHSISRTDTVKSNSIPAGAETIVSIPAPQTLQFEKDANTLLNLIKARNLPVEDGLSYSITSCSGALPSPLTRASSDSIILLLNQLPHGVIRMIPSNPVLVETSTNLYDVRFREDNVALLSSNRSSNNDSLGCLNRTQQNIANCLGFEASGNNNYYPIWRPCESSLLLKTAKQVYKDMYADTYEATVIHAGLECGWMVEKSKGRIDCIAIGPTIENAHTINERLLLKDNGIDTIASFYACVSQIISELAGQTVEIPNPPTA